MEILLYDQQKCYFDSVIQQLEHDFKNTIQIVICMNLEELRRYDNQLIRVVIVADNDKNLEMLQLLKMRHHESQIIFVGDDYLYLQKVISIGVHEYFIMPLEINILCISVEKILTQKSKWSLPLKDTSKKHIFMSDDIKYIETSYNDFIIVTNDNQRFTSSVKNNCYMKLFMEHGFLQVNQSVLINFHYIDYIAECLVVLQTREIFQISNKNFLAKYKEEIRDAHRHS